MLHAACCVRQGVWTHWENVIPFDLSWANLIYGPGPKVVAFVLNAQINSCRTPEMLKLWGYVPSAQCRLCGAAICSLHHILVGCKLSLSQSRYNWRHDSVLAHIEQALEELLGVFNKRVPTKTSDAARASYEASFVRAGEKKKVSARVSHNKLSTANDWQLLVDYEHHMMVFPPAVYTTNLRPDIVIYSKRAAEVILIELTCCAEEGIAAAQLRKEVKYTELVAEINATKSWHATLFTLEIGARGLVHSTTFRVFTELGFPGPKANKLCKTLSSIVARCSYVIFMAQKSRAWRCPELIVPTEESKMTLRSK
jgi:hypothetical protein